MSTTAVVQSRKERWRGALLAIISTAFIAVGVLAFCRTGSPWLVLMLCPLFGAMLLTGVFQMVRPGQGIPPALTIIGCFGLTASAAMFTIGEQLDSGVPAWRKQLVLIVGTVATVFFGGGGMLLHIRQILRRRPTT